MDTGRSGGDERHAGRRALRERSGWLLSAAGALLCVLGWYAVSGESVTARQVPYLASATIPGAALIVAGAVVATARRHAADDLRWRLDRLLTLLVEPEPSGGGLSPAPAGPDDGPSVALPDGTLHHRRACPLVAGKAGARTVTTAEIRARALAPCPVCEPPEAASADAGSAEAAPRRPSAGEAPSSEGLSGERPPGGGSG
ncbi:hypothetical protein AB0K51_00645 [Kitasatospora sp. NPDC049285]|uniref:hypothetical protein n=1 Tax=Kitasatospora sp. NPDC049285 TaxID=3157096 RepID=UPI003444D088